MPAKLANTNRVPNYKAIAMCILKNDLKLRGIGFGETESRLVSDLYHAKKRLDSDQMQMF